MNLALVGDYVLMFVFESSNKDLSVHGEKTLQILIVHCLRVALCLLLSIPGLLIWDLHVPVDPQVWTFVDQIL